MVYSFSFRVYLHFFSTHRFAGQKLNVPVAVAAAFPFDSPYEVSSGHHLIHSARAVEWSVVSSSINAFRTSLGLRPQEQDETSFVPFIAGYSPIFSPLPLPLPSAPHCVSGFWRTAPEVCMPSSLFPCPIPISSYFRIDHFISLVMLGVSHTGLMEKNNVLY